MISKNAQEPPDQSVDAERKRLEVEHLRLENEKLGLEITESKRRWYLKPNHSIYLLIAVCTLAVGFVTDKYQASSSRVAAERDLLEQRKNDFAMQRDVVQKELTQTKTQLEDKSHQLASVNQQLTSTQQELLAANHDKELAKLERSLQSTEKSLSLLASKKMYFIQDFKTMSPKPKILRGLETPATQLKLSPALQRILVDQKSGVSMFPKATPLSQWTRKPPAKETWYQYLKRKTVG